MHLCLHCLPMYPYRGFPHTKAEMPTLNGALKEYERHFSGIRGNFPECHIFCHKSTKFTHTSFLQDKLQYRVIQYPLPCSKCMAESFTGLQLASVRTKDLHNLMNFDIHTTFWPRNPFCFVSQAGSRTRNYLPTKVTSFE